MGRAGTEPDVSDPLGAGHEALGLGEWERARACFESALERGESAEAIEALQLTANHKVVQPASRYPRT